MARYRFWFYNKDREGQPLDENVLKTAEKIAPILSRYRYQEIDSESKCNDLLQQAAEAASRASRKNPIANLAGYIARIYKHIVDDNLEYEGRVVPVSDEALESLANTQRVPSFEEWVNGKLDLHKLMDSLEGEAQQIWKWRIEGYSQSEIAKRLGMSANTVSMKATRAFKEAVAGLQSKRNPKRTDAR
jgi:RNA polymerase sigma factor (sigma-70 family)